MAGEFDKALTLIQHAQNMPGDSAERAVLETFVEESDVMGVIPIIGANGGKYSWPQEEELPEAKFRAYNELGNESQGRTSKQEEGVFLMDEYIKVDRALVDEKGPQERARQEAMRTKAMARLWTRVFIAGDNVADQREPNGLKARSAEPRQFVLANSNASGGGALSLANLDTILNEVKSPSHIIMDRTMKPLLSAAARSPTLTNNMLNMDMTDPFGRKVLSYDGIPILFGYPKSRGDSVLPFNEVAAGGGSAVTTSIYAVNFSEEGIFGIEGTALAVEDEGKIPGVPLLSTHIKWDWGLVSKEYSIARLTSVAKAPIVA